MGITYNSVGNTTSAVEVLQEAVDASLRSYYDNFEFAVASAVASEHWTGEVFAGAAEASDADINTTTAGKAYVIADPDGTPAATAYWLRKNKTVNASSFTIIVDADYTWGTEGAGNLDGGLYITKGAAYDANNHFYIVRRKSTTGPLDNITIDGALNGVGLTAATANITDDAVAFKVERVNDQWRFYYSTAQSPDYTWVYIGYYEDTSNFMTDEVSYAIGGSSPGVADAESVQIDFDNLQFFINTASIDEMLSEGYNSAHIAANADGSVMERLEWVQVALGGGALQLRVEQSKSGAVEEDSFMAFAISLFDIDTGAVQAADIDITGITVNLEKSTGGAAFSNAGITQPVFAKANGLVSIDYRFLAAEWEIGDTYRLAVSGITCTVAGDTAYVKDVVWSNLITELVNVEAKIDAIQADIGDPSSRTNFQDIENMIGIPDAANSNLNDMLNTGFDSSGLTANEDGSIIERLEQIQESVNVGTGTSLAANESLADVLYSTNGISTFPAAAAPGNGVSIAEVLRQVYDQTVATEAGKFQFATTTEDLNQVAGTYDLLTGTGQDVMLESFVIQMPDAAAAGAVTSISIVTDDSTAATIISVAEGAVGNLTAQAQLSWKGSLKITVGTKLQLILAGGAHGSTYTTSITAGYRAITAGGTLA